MWRSEGHVTAFYSILKEVVMKAIPPVLQRDESEDKAPYY